MDKKVAMRDGTRQRATRSRRSPIAVIIGLLGELLITAGVLLLLFVVWQLWWTDVVAGGEQTQIMQELESEWGPAPQQVAPAEDSEPPTVAAPAMDQVWGTLHVPKFDRVVSPIAEGVSLEKVLNVKGNGHYPDTAMPGEVGNFSLAGHRSTYGRPLHDIARLEVGDPIIVETAEAYYVYRVTEAHIVMPNQVEVVAPVPNDPGATPTQKMLTLTACHPQYSARERYIVHAEYSHWVDRSKGIPEELAKD